VIYRDWDGDGATPVVDPDLEIDNGLYNATRRRMVLSSEGYIRSLKELPCAEHGFVSIIIKLDEWGSLDDPYSLYDLPSMHVRLFFESDADEQNMIYCDITRVPNPASPASPGFGSLYLFTLNQMSSGDPKLLHWTAMYRNELGLDDAAGENTEYWVTLSRSSCFSLSHTRGCFDGYAVHVRGTTFDLFGYSPARRSPRPAIMGVMDTEVDPTLANVGIGANRAKALADPPGRFFGVRRMDAASTEVDIALIAGGHLKSFAPPPSVRTKRCFFSDASFHAPIIEAEPKLPRVVINGAYSIAEPDSQKAYFTGSFGTAINAEDNGPRVPSAPPFSWRRRFWSGYISCWLESSVSGREGFVSQGESTPILHVTCALIEMGEGLDDDGNGTDAFGSEYHLDWDFETPLASHALADGFDIVLDVADATVTDVWVPNPIFTQLPLKFAELVLTPIAV